MSASSSKTVLIGNFDGLHLGHQKLIRFAQKISKESNTQLTLVTFRPHPRKVLSKDGINLILPYDEKLKTLKELGIEDVDEIKLSTKDLCSILITLLFPKTEFFSCIPISSSST